MQHYTAIEHDPENNKWGDCFRCCLASVMGLRRCDVPHFFDGGTEAEAAFAWVRRFLRIRGKVLGQVNYEGTLDDVLLVSGEYMPDVAMIVGGVTVRGTPHVVVVHKGQVAMDAGSQLVGPLPHGMFTCYFLSPVVR